MNKLSAVLCLATAALLAASHSAAEDGAYVGLALGYGTGGSLVLDGTDDDVATTCDGWIVPLDGTNAGCNPPPSAWTTDLDSNGTGALASLAVGYRWPRFRAEVEYVHAAPAYDATADLAATDAVTVDKSQQETDLAETSVGTVLHDGVFANVYWHFKPGADVSPYVGLGIGLSRASIDYFNRWKRNINPDRISTFDGHPDADALHRKLAGTTTIASTTLTDNVTAYQALAGVDFRLAETVTLGVKARWLDYGDFDSGRLLWDQLRSHYSSRSPGGADVLYSISTDDLSLWSASVEMKYHF